MIQLIKKITAFASFMVVLFMHVYFVLLLAAKPALAEDSTQPAQVEAEAPGETVEPATNEVKMDDKQFTFKVNDKKGTVRIDSNGIQISNLVKDTDTDSDEVTVVSSVGKMKVAKDWSDVLEDVLVPIVLFLSAFGFAAYFVYAKSRTRRDYLETIRAIAQSGQPIPPELLNNMNSNLGINKTRVPSAGTYDANAAQGVKYIFWGVGIMGCMLLIPVSFAASIGFLFIVMGGYHIYTSQMMQKQKTTDTAATTTTEVK